MNAAAREALAFMRWVEDRAAARSIAFQWGTALFHDDLRYVYDRNFVRVEAAVPSVRALVSEVERLQGRAGLLHQRVVMEDQVHARALGDYEFNVGQLQLMAAVRPADHPAGTPAEEVDQAALEPARRAFLEAQPFGGDPETIRQLLANDRILTRVANGHAFAARGPDGEVAAYCRLYTDGRVFQIEDVATLPAYRGQGLARAVVGAARARAEAEGAGLVFLTARGDDWPRQLYEKLGFEPIGARYECVRAAAPVR